VRTAGAKSFFLPLFPEIFDPMADGSHPDPLFLIRDEDFCELPPNTPVVAKKFSRGAPLLTGQPPLSFEPFPVEPFRACYRRGFSIDS